MAQNLCDSIEHLSDCSLSLNSLELSLLNDSDKDRQIQVLKEKLAQCSCGFASVDSEQSLRSESYINDRNTSQIQNVDNVKGVQLIYLDGWDVKAVTRYGVVTISDYKFKIYDTEKSHATEDLFRYIKSSKYVDKTEYAKTVKKIKANTRGTYDDATKKYINPIDAKEWRYCPPSINKYSTSGLRKLALDNSIEFDNDNYTYVFYDIETMDIDPNYFGVPDINRETSHIVTVQVLVYDTQSKNTKIYLLCLEKYKNAISKVQDQLKEKYQNLTFELYLTEQSLAT